jgi:catechol 2,3-dioxygenase-like lactoylglutathione lyase family enzyme
MISAMPQPLQRLVPLAHVAQLPRSIAFYQKLGFQVVHSITSAELGPEPHWAFLRSGGAELMIALATAPVDPEQQAILFYLYVNDVAALHVELKNAGLPISEMTHPDHRPAGEFRVADPDGYCLLIGQP